MLSRLPSSVFAALGLLFFSFALSACASKITAPPEPPLAVRLGDDAFRLQDYEAAIDDYQVYIDSVEHGEYTPFAFYQTALCWYRLEQYEQCLDTIAELSRRYPNEHWVQVDALHGDAQYKLGRRTAALMAWDQGWSNAEAKEKPEFRRRIVSLLREMDEAELAEASQIVESSEVAALVDHHLAIQRQDGLPVAAPAPATRARTREVEEVQVAAAPREAMPPPAEEGTSTSEAILRKDTAPPQGPSADALAMEAETVADRADEVDRLADEVTGTGDEVFEAVRETEESRGQIAEVETSMAGFAPLTKVEIPEPPFVDRPVPQPKKRIQVASPSEATESTAQPQGIVEEPVGTTTSLEGEAVIEPDDTAQLEPVAAPPVEVPVRQREGAPKVACVLPLTGAHRDMGENILRGIRLVFGAGSDAIVFRDSGSDPESARRLVAELSSEDDVLIAIVPAAASDARSMARSAESAAVPVLLLSPTNVPTSRYVMHVRPENAGTQSFATSYRETYGKAPDMVNAQAYEAALLAQEALNMAPIPREDVLSRIAARGALEDGAPPNARAPGNAKAMQVAAIDPVD
jgi:tetratricopeptide (TPR) repeat protein